MREQWQNYTGTYLNNFESHILESKNLVAKNQVSLFAQYSYNSFSDFCFSIMPKGYVQKCGFFNFI